MKTGNSLKKWGILAVTLSVLTAGTSGILPVSASSLLSVTDEAQIRPIGDGSERYIMKSDGFYCLKEDGSKDTVPAVHYFDHMKIDGTVLDGFYYHDESGCFQAGSSHMVKITKLSCQQLSEEDSEAEEKVFDGYYMVNNLGKLTAAPQVRYISNYTVDKTIYDGYYYFDETGRMVTEPGTHELDMTSNGQRFYGTYYFGGTNGVLVQEAGMTEDGYPVDATGKVTEIENLGIDTLKPQLESMLASYDGEWSVYVKDLETNEDFVLNDLSLSEIAEDREISRQGVYDIVRRCRKQLQGYEAKLHLVAKFIHTKERVAEINHYANEILEHQEDHQRMIECINRIEVLSNTIVEEL